MSVVTHLVRILATLAGNRALAGTSHRGWRFPAAPVSLRRLSFPLALAALSFSLPASASLSLLGDSVTGCIDLGASSCTPTTMATVTDPGVEFTGGFKYVAGQITATADFTGDTLTIHIVNSYGSGGTSTGNGISFAFEDLDFLGSIPSEITAVQTLTNDLGLSVSFTSNSLTLSRSGLFIFAPSDNGTSTFRLTAEEAQSTVPEPTTLALVAAALLAAAVPRKLVRRN